MLGPMKDPTHPGEIIREEVIRPLGLSVTAADSALGVNRQALSAFLNQRSDLLPEMALRIEVALGPKAEVMMGIQRTTTSRAPPRDQGHGPPDQSADLLTPPVGGAERSPNHAPIRAGPGRASPSSCSDGTAWRPPPRGWGLDPGRDQ